MQIKEKTFEPYISADEIASVIQTLANSINADYKEKEVVFIGVLNGAFMFAADLFKNIQLSCEISFIKVASYQGLSSSGEVHELIGLVADVKNKHVVILEDIVDTGLTLNKLHAILKHEKPASIAVATLLFKPDAFQGTIPPKYIGKSIPNKFVVGYGLDYDGFGRNSKEIFKLKE